MSKDVLFIHPGKQDAEYQGLALEFTAVAPPVWTALLAHAARSRGFDACVHDVNIQGWDDATALGLLSTHDPALIVMMVYGHHPSASTQTMPAASGIARDIKRLDPDRTVAMGGLHPSALPARTLAEEAVDYVIQGEGPHDHRAARALRGRFPRATCAASGIGKTGGSSPAPPPCRARRWKPPWADMPGTSFRGSTATGPTACTASSISSTVRTLIFPTCGRPTPRCSRPSGARSRATTAAFTPSPGVLDQVLA
jgi:hypothetical protein